MPPDYQILQYRESTHGKYDGCPVGESSLQTALA